MPFETPDLIPRPVEIPTRVDGDGFSIRPLTVDDAERDYEAVTRSSDRIRGTFGPDHDWPPADLTLAQNRIDVAWHHKEFQRRDAFTYAVVDPDETTELGCLYVQPTRTDSYDATVYFWLADAALERGLASPIEDRLRRWISTEWPLDTVAYPGRDISWSEWREGTTT